ncbi:MAG: prepilin-type N-terminal cleavage/methylation domain-containing protein [Armatimonadetes bacterium]|nr:prepilin-type N-terminal cleavage/methylation domain-containing protein [Armatimonadota bacterium]MBS1702564.1 prepilin-type N-terminal cleavage/methylation domain-containing protein [Armatimonadota bacterium]MBS1725992.1 prepilin-type N-terminal cleavage/methylation domain-containing protein [Armatimonadota bacterium]
MKQSTQRPSSKAFTLIELLVVIAIIAILAAILFPVFAQAKLAAKKASDLSNTKQLALGIYMYGSDVDDTYPFCWGWNSEWRPWHIQVAPYVKNLQIWRSPVDNWNRGNTSTYPAIDPANCSDPNKPAIGVTYSMNYTWPAGGWGWSSNDEQELMSPTSSAGGASQTSVPSVATTIIMAPRPNWYHQWCQGWATEVFFNYGEFTMQGGGQKMFGNGTNYGFCDGHSKFMAPAATLVPQGAQSGMAKPADWPSGTDWPWPVGMWDKRQ